LLSNFFSLLIIAARRVWNHRLLMLCLLVGLVVAVGILSSIPLYADAVQHRLMQGELIATGTYRPPFAFLWRYIGTWNGNIDQESRPLDEYLCSKGHHDYLPLSTLVRHVQTDKARLFPAAEAYHRRKPLLWMTLGFISARRSHPAWRRRVCAKPARQRA
jgi:putative ABC transport system permease protein